MQYRWIIGERHGDWNIKGCGDAARFFASNFYFSERKHVATFAGNVARMCHIRKWE
jgi:hypothetical protein